MNNTEFLELIEEYPGVTICGFGVNMDNANGLTPRAYFAQERESLRRQLANFELCLEWLEKNPHLEGRFNAHYYKDRVQDECTPHSHIPRGVFILAALYKGYEVTMMQGSTDAWISEGGAYHGQEN